MFNKSNSTLTKILTKKSRKWWGIYEKNRTTRAILNRSRGCVQLPFIQRHPMPDMNSPLGYSGDLTIGHPNHWTVWISSKIYSRLSRCNAARGSFSSIYYIIWHSFCSFFTVKCIPTVYRFLVTSLTPFVTGGIAPLNGIQMFGIHMVVWILDSI